MSWLPIETAPKNRQILAWNGEGISIASWDSLHGHWTDPEWFHVSATHWQPLPEPPTELIPSPFPDITETEA